MFKLTKCPKEYTSDLDKATTPERTLQKVKDKLEKLGGGIVNSLERVDTSRLGIPVYICSAGGRVSSIMPAKKQMGKGAFPEQAQASALMELLERYSLFAFLNEPENFVYRTWTEAKEYFGSQLIPLSEILFSVGEKLPPEKAEQVLDLIEWDFFPALHLQENRLYYLPVNWFKKLNEFNGSSAGNTFEESVLQGGCELLERHLSAWIDNKQPVLPTIDPHTITDPVLERLFQSFVQNNIEVWLKDFSLNMGVPTVGVLAYDVATFPDTSEIVFTAGTATSPEKAAIRALTEIAQLGGDFESGSIYEPSGLSKFESIRDTDWLKQGVLVSIHSLPNISDQDLLQEIRNLTDKLQVSNYNFYTLDISNPELEVPANFNIVPGFLFRERSPNASLGLFVGRILAEEYPAAEALHKLELLQEIYPGKYFIPFFQGILQVRTGDIQGALRSFSQAEPLQPSPQEQSLVAFYRAYAHTQLEKWDQAREHLDRAISLSRDNHAFYNLRGVALFKLRDYFQAAQDFQKALNIDRDSAIDWANLGMCHKFMENFPKAKEFLEKGLSLDPSLGFAQNHLKELT